MNKEIEITAPIKTGKTSMKQLLMEHLGLEQITGEYMCWDAQGFHMWVEGNDIPVYVITREFSFDDYPGSEEPDKEGRMVQVIGRYDENTNSIQAVQYCLEGEEFHS